MIRKLSHTRTRHAYATPHMSDARSRAPCQRRCTSWRRHTLPATMQRPGDRAAPPPARPPPLLRQPRCPASSQHQQLKAALKPGLGVRAAAHAVHGAAPRAPHLWSQSVHALAPASARVVSRQRGSSEARLRGAAAEIAANKRGDFPSKALRVQHLHARASPLTPHPRRHVDSSGSQAPLGPTAEQRWWRHTQARSAGARTLPGL